MTKKLNEATISMKCHLLCRGRETKRFIYKWNIKIYVISTIFKTILCVEYNYHQGGRLFVLLWRKEPWSLLVFYINPKVCAGLWFGVPSGMVGRFRRARPFREAYHLEAIIGCFSSCAHASNIQLVCLVCNLQVTNNADYSHACGVCMWQKAVMITRAFYVFKNMATGDENSWRSN